MNNRTFAIIKPDAVKNKYAGLIYDRILKANFKILSSKLIRMTKKQAEHFYLVHKDRPFYDELTSFMSSGQCMVLALQKETMSWYQIILSHKEHTTQWDMVSSVDNVIGEPIFTAGTIVVFDPVVICS